MVKTLLFIGAGSFLGGVSRYALTRLVQDHILHVFPYGTLVVNIVGCFLIGLFYGLFLYQKWSGHSIQFVSNKTGKTTDITLYLRAIVARLADVVIINLLIQTKLNLHYGFIPQEAYGAAIVARVAKNVIELAIDLPLLFILLPVALKAYQHIFRRSVSPKVAG